MSAYVLDKAFKIATIAGVAANRVVVRTGNQDECKLPAAAYAGEILGVTTYPQSRQDRFVGVRRMGIASTMAAGVIARGARVCIADNAGRVAQMANAIYLTGIVGSNNALTFQWVGSKGAPFSISLVNPGAAAAFSWSFVGGELSLSLLHNGSVITETASTLIGKIAADDTLAQLISVASTAGSNGSGTLTAANSGITNILAIAHPVGIAEEPATAAGDIIDVFLTN
ncbi:hypothetical protein BH09SUM1_BH09SUM1_07210 [soil metagenome]